jgi:hypothetical protein
MIENLDVQKRQSIAKACLQGLEDGLLCSKPGCDALRTGGDLGQYVPFALGEASIKEIIGQKQQLLDFGHID